MTQRIFSGEFGENFAVHHDSQNALRLAGALEMMKSNLMTLVKDFGSILLEQNLTGIGIMSVLARGSVVGLNHFPHAHLRLHLQQMDLQDLDQSLLEGI